jgi:DNA-binding MarR family transcriptional regulator
MPLLMLNDLPRYECLIEASREFPDLDPSATEAFLHLLRSGDEAFRVVESHLASHGSSQGRFSVLMSLWRSCRQNEDGAQTLSPAELAERTGVTRATITGLVDTLERDDLVTRTPDPADRRMMSVRLTAKGERLLGEILPQHFQRMAWLMEPLNEDERRTMVRLLGKITQRAAEAPQAPEPAAVPAAALAVHA